MSDHGERRHEDVSRLEREIGNSIKLDNLLTSVETIRQKQETDHSVLLALAEHKTIERVDTLWTSMGELRFTLRSLVGIVISISVVLGILEITHKVWGWP